MTLTIERFSSTGRLSLKPRQATDKPSIISSTYVCLPAHHVSAQEYISSSQPSYSSVLVSVCILMIDITLTT